MFFRSPIAKAIALLQIHLRIINSLTRGFFATLILPHPSSFVNVFVQLHLLILYEHNFSNKEKLSFK
nr:MAG TPA: hypothetical protein [Caudoviricetes sp.]